MRKHLTKNQVRAALRKKRRMGLLPPQECGSPRCGASLRDETVPPEYEEYRPMFSLAVERRVGEVQAVFECPVCGWQTRPHRVGRQALQ